MAKVRTNIEIDEDAVQRIMERYSLRTKTEAVDMALQNFAGLIPLTTEELLALEGAHLFGDPPPDQTPRGVD